MRTNRSEYVANSALAAHAASYAQRDLARIAASVARGNENSLSAIRERARKAAKPRGILVRLAGLFRSGL